MAKAKSHKPAHKGSVHKPAMAGPPMGSPMDVAGHPSNQNMTPPPPGMGGMDMGMPPGSPMMGGPGI